MLHWGYKYAGFQWPLLLRGCDDDREVRRCLFWICVVRYRIWPWSKPLIPYVDFAFKLTFISATVVVLLMQEASRSKKVIARSHVLVIPPKPVEPVITSQPTPKLVFSRQHPVSPRHMVLLAAIVKQQLVMHFPALHLLKMIWLLSCVLQNVLVSLCSAWNISESAIAEIQWIPEVLQHRRLTASIHVWETNQRIVEEICG